MEEINDEKQWRGFISQFSIEPSKEGHEGIVEKTKELVIASIRKNIPDERFGILFSGGVDSTVIAKVCKDYKSDFVCYTSALEEKGLKPAEDLEAAKIVAKTLNLKLKTRTIGLKETEEYIKNILKILREPDVVKVGVALPFYISYEMARKDSINIMFSGLGSEEIFAGYERHLKANDISKECLNGLFLMYNRDITRDEKIAKALNISLKVPFLEPQLIDYALKIPPEYKINSKGNKVILREAAEKLGIKEFAWRKKRAAQYGSRFARAIEKLAKRNGFKFKKDYLKSLL